MSYSVQLRAGRDGSVRNFSAEPDQAILDAGLAAELPLPYGCRNAVCRACVVTVAQGEVYYPLGSPPTLSSPEFAAGKALICQARARSDLVLDVDELLTSQPQTLPCRLVAKQWLNHDVLELRLVLRDGDHLNALAGQYVDLVLRDGRRRAFSVASAPPRGAGGAREFELQIRIVPEGEFSGYAAAHLKPRALLRVHGPLGSFYLRKDQDWPVILIAGGTGFAPIKAMVEDLIADHADGVDRPPSIHLYWGARAEPDLYLRELADSWCRKLPDFRFTPVLSEPSPGWGGRTGLVHAAVLEDHSDLSGHSVYISGPPVMVQAVRNTFGAAGVDFERVHADSFDYAHVTGHDAIG